MPRVRSSVIGPDDLDVRADLGSNTPPELRESEVGVEDIDVISAKDMEDTVKMAKFMEEFVVVEIEDDPEDENAPVFLYVGHNGISQYIKRGEPQRIRRKYLYAALAAKRVKFSCSFGKDGAGREFNNLNPSASTTYRIHLVEDRNPQGGTRWAQRVAQGVA